MRSLAILAALALIPTGAFALSVPGQTHPSASPLGERALLAEASPLHLHSWFLPSHTLLQTGSTPVPTSGTPAPTVTPSETATPVATPVPSTTAVTTATPTSTVTPYPDPVNLLKKTAVVYEGIRSAHFEIISDGNQPKVEKVHLDVVGDVTCTGPSLQGHVSAKDTVVAGNKVSNLSLSFIIVRKAAYQKSQSTKNQWKKTTTSNFTRLGISADNLLICPSNSSGSSSGGSSGSSGGQFKNLVNLGPATFQGHAVWHIRATEVTTDTSGRSVKVTFNLFIDRTNHLPYEQTYKQTDQGVTVTQKEILTKFGEKLHIKAPAVAKAAAKKSATKKTTPKKKKP